MDGETAFRLGFLIVISTLRLLVAIPLYLTARRNNLVSLYWLSAQFIALVIAVPFAAIGPLDNRWIFWTFISLSEIALIMFVHTTFRRERSSAMPVLMTLAVIGLIGGLYGTITNNFELSAWMVYPNAVFAWGWHLIEAWRSYTGIAQDENAEDWIKSRYTLMISYSIVDFLGAVIGTLVTTGLWNNDLVSLLVVLINITSVILQVLVWVMPEPFRKWLNRNYQSRTRERIHEKAALILNAIGEGMCENTGLTKMMALFALRKTLGERFKTEDAAQIEAKAVQLEYSGWVDLLNSPALYTLINNSGTNINPVEVVTKAKRALALKQSLFTMQAK